MDLNNVPLGWLEYDNHKGKPIPISDRSKRVYRSKTGSYDPFSKTAELTFPDIKEMGLITSGWLYKYGKTIFPGMYRAEINDRFNKLKPLGTGYALTKSDMEGLMMAYYKMEGEVKWDSKSHFNGVPVPIVREITGKHQCVVREDLNLEASPDLRGKTLHVRVEFPMPVKKAQIPQGYLNAIVFHDDRLIRLRWCQYSPSKNNETKIVLSRWEAEEKMS
jgi:hypothetical protein